MGVLVVALVFLQISAFRFFRDSVQKRVSKVKVFGIGYIGLLMQSNVDKMFKKIGHYTFEA